MQHSKLLRNQTTKVVIGHITRNNSQVNQNSMQGTNLEKGFQTRKPGTYISMTLLKLPNSAGMNPTRPLLLKLLEKHVPCQCMNRATHLRDSNPKTYSLNRCSKLPIDDGIGPVIILQDKSLVRLSLLNIV